MTIAGVPDTVSNLPRLCAQMKDPPGILLDRNQRADRAAHLLAVACGVALLDAGWQIEEQPGLIYLERSDKQLNIYALMNELRTGLLTPEAWKTKCRDLGIAQLPLAALQPPEASAAG
jgi:hypothetical protein